MFENLDRFSRAGVMKALGPYMVLLNAGLYLVTTDDGKPYRAEDELMAILMPAVALSRAHDKSTTKVKRQRQKWDVKRADGLTGKILTHSIPGWLDIADGKFRFNAHRQTIITIFEYSAGGMGAHSIAHMLNDRKVPTLKTYQRPRETSWHRSTIKELLGSRAVIGEFQPHHYVKVEIKVDDKTEIKIKRVPRGDPNPTYYVDAETGEPAISHDLFQRSTRETARRAGKGGRRGTRFANLLSGLAKCAECLGVMTFQNSRADKGYLMCNSARRHAGCTNRRTFATVVIDRLIMDDLGGLMLASDDLRDEAQPIRAEIAKLQSGLSSRRSMITNYQAAFEADPALVGRTALARIATLETEMDDLMRAITEAQKRYDIATARLPTDRHVAAIAEQRAKARSEDDKIAYAARAAINASLKEIIDVVEFDAQRNVDIIIGNWSRAIRVVDGKITQVVGPEALQQTVRAELEDRNALSGSRFEAVERRLR